MEDDELGVRDGTVLVDVAEDRGPPIDNAVEEKYFRAQQKVGLFGQRRHGSHAAGSDQC